MFRPPPIKKARVAAISYFERLPVEIYLNILKLADYQTVANCYSVSRRLNSILSDVNHRDSRQFRKWPIYSFDVLENSYGSFTVDLVSYSAKALPEHIGKLVNSRPSVEPIKKGTLERWYGYYVPLRNLKLLFNFVDPRILRIFNLQKHVRELFEWLKFCYTERNSGLEIHHCNFSRVGLEVFSDFMLPRIRYLRDITFENNYWVKFTPSQFLTALGRPERDYETYRLGQKYPLERDWSNQLAELILTGKKFNNFICSNLRINSSLVNQRLYNWVDHSGVVEETKKLPLDVTVRRKDCFVDPIVVNVYRKSVNLCFFNCIGVQNSHAFFNQVKHWVIVSRSRFKMRKLKVKYFENDPGRLMNTDRPDLYQVVVVKDYEGASFSVVLRAF